MYTTILLQPTYIPSILNTAAMAQCSTIVFEVMDNFNKQSLRNRAYIETANGRLHLTIPIKHNKHKTGHKKTAEALIENDFRWQRQHWLSIQTAYRSSPYFEFYEDDFNRFYEQPYTELLDYILNYNYLIIDLLKIGAAIRQTTHYEKKCQFTDLRPLVDSKKNYGNINLPPYIQVFAENENVEPKTAVIDLLFSEGPNALDYLKSIDLRSLEEIK